MKSLKALKQNNKGAGIVTVVVVLSFLTTIGLLIMAISYTSSEMRASERWGREVAYNANGVVEQMRSGAELAVSDSIKACYTHVMSNYSAYRDIIEKEFDREFNRSLNDWKPYKLTANEADPDNPNTVYYTGEKDENGKMVETSDQTAAIKLLTGDVQIYDTIGTESYWVYKNYNVKALEAFVKAGFGGSATVNCLVDGNIVESGMGNVDWEFNDEGGVTTPSRAILKDVVVDYSRLMRTVRITTDIVIDFPDLGYVYNEETPSSKFTEFAIVALKSITQQSGYVDVEGKAYTGNLNIAGTSRAQQLQLKKGGLLICNGDINVSGNNINNAGSTDSLIPRSSLLIDSTSTVWAKNINVRQNGIAALCYRANILNDLNLSASGASVYIDGTYYGFGASETNPAQSSAINIQGFKNGDDQSSTVIQFEDYANVTLAGFSFISTNNSNGNTGIKTGQSMAVAEDQVAYLVPIEMLNYAIDETWLLKINTNPEILTNDLNGATATDKYNVILAQLNNKNNKPIQNTLWTIGGTAMKPDDYGITVNPVAIPYAQYQIVYFFMEFNATSERTAIENRNQFFRDYFTNNTDRVRNYLEQYMSLSDISDYFGSVGNTYTIDKDSNKVVLRALSSIIKIDSIMNTVNNKLNAFSNLLITLNEGFGPEHALEDDLGTDEEKEARSHVNNPFNYYVKEDLVNAALDKMPASDKTIRFYNAQGNLVAVITSKPQFEYDGSDPDLCLIISTSETGNKDVVISSDFTGLIMCKGEVYVESASDPDHPVTLTADSDAVNEAMGAATIGGYTRTFFGFDPIEGNDTNFIMPYEFLFYKYTPNQSEFDIDEGSYWDVGTLVYFDRWKKG